MEAKELRIGNFVMIQVAYEVGKVAQLWEEEVMFRCGDVYLYSDIFPIMLNTEWLMKLGFKKQGIGYYVLMNGVKIKLFFDGCIKGILIIIKSGGFRYYKKDIKFVHQLQNLVFVMTGDELKIS